MQRRDFENRAGEGALVVVVYKEEVWGAGP